MKLVVEYQLKGCIQHILVFLLLAVVLSDVGGTDVSIDLPPNSQCGDYQLLDINNTLVLSVYGISSNNDSINMTTSAATYENDRDFSTNTPVSVTCNTTADINDVTSSDQSNMTSPTSLPSSTQISNLDHARNTTSDINLRAIELNGKNESTSMNITFTNTGDVKYVTEDAYVVIEEPFVERSHVSFDPSLGHVTWSYRNVTADDLGIFSLIYNRTSNETDCVDGFSLETSAGGKVSLLYLWTSWGTWSACGRTCEDVRRSRTRSCPKEAECGGGEITQIEQCQSEGFCSAWSVWSTCSTTCGPGSRHRSRDCGPLGGCPPDEDMVCSMTACSDGWLDWTKWSACSLTCDGGVTTRSRDCSFKDRQCEGNSSEEVTCNEHVCEDPARHISKDEPMPLAVIIGIAVGVFMLALLVVVVILLRRLKWKKQNTMYAISQGKPKAVRSLSDPDPLARENFYTDIDLEPRSPTHVYIPTDIAANKDDITSCSETRTNTSSFKLKHMRQSFKTVDIPDSADVAESAECSETESVGMPTATELSSLHPVEEDDQNS